jgi:hypothetical protein
MRKHSFGVRPSFIDNLAERRSSNTGSQGPDVSIFLGQSPALQDKMLGSQKLRR